MIISRKKRFTENMAARFGRSRTDGLDESRGSYCCSNLHFALRLKEKFVGGQLIALPAIKQNPLEMISFYLILGTHYITNNEMKSSSSRKPSVIYVRFLFEVVLLPNNSRLFMAG